MIAHYVSTAPNRIERLEIGVHDDSQGFVLRGRRPGASEGRDDHGCHGRLSPTHDRGHGQISSGPLRRV